MKRIITLLSFGLIIQFSGLHAQKLNYETTSPWFWGLNAGAAWNTTDVRNQTNWGWGITLGRSFNFDYGNTFSFDLRGRYLGGAWMGQDFDTSGFQYPNTALSSGATNYKDSIGFAVNNFKTKAHELDLELVIHLNRFIEKTGLDPYIFGGVGLTWYNTRGNLLDDNLEMYDYASLSDYNKGSITGLLNDDFESYLDGSSSNYNVAFMPSVGIGLGYHFGPRFSMGFEHKTTFSLTDNFDGVVNPQGDFENDWYHYTSVYFKHYFKWRGEGSSNVNNNSNTNNLNNGGCQVPLVAFRSPSNNQTVGSPNLNFTADVAHTTNRENIVITVNGVTTTNFVYSTQTNKLEGSGYLQQGQNTVVISATNSCGTTTETLYINYKPDCIQPVVNFTTPSNPNQSVSANTYYVTADISNMNKEGNIAFLVNGVPVTAYNWNYQNGKFSSTVVLREGMNTFEIQASNACGTASANSGVNYAFTCLSPTIQVVSPSSGISLEQQSIDLQVKIANITSTSQVQLTVNGASQTGGSYSSSNGLYTKNIRLVSGQNTIVITATNNCGTSSETIILNHVPKCDNPVVIIRNPATAGTSVNTALYTVIADLMHVPNAQSITFRVNGVAINTFTYNSQTGKFSANVSLQQGANTIEIIATNNCGTGSDITVINYKYECPKPTVQFINPAGVLTVSDKNYTVQALVSNISNASQVQLKVNGIVQTQGTYAASNALFSKAVILQNGSNTIELTATNNCGVVSQSATVIYNEPVLPPAITITSACNVEIQPGQHYVSGFVANVTNQSQVQITVNGAIVSNATFVSSNQGLSFGFNVNAQENPGTYTVVVSATNASGTYTQSCLITVRKPPVDNDIVICIMQGREPVTLTIKESQWPQYQAQGAKLGPCPVVDNEIVICVTQNGKPTTLTIKESQWPQYQAQGAKLGPCPVVDNDIVICVTQNGKPTTLTIKESQWPQYQAQGAKLGPCPVVDNDIVICVTQNGKQTTLTIKESQWPQYQAQGAKLGPCPVVDNDIVICIMQGREPVTLTIKESQWPQYQAQGAKLGPCPVVDNDIVICVTQNGKPTTLTIKESQWPKYQAQGAKLGPCPVVDNDIVICVTQNGKPTTLTIKESQWPKYQAQGAKLGPCPVVDNDIVICVTQNGKPTTLTIKESQWPKYQAQGAKLGPCPVVDNDIVICVTQNGKPTTLTIKESQWPKYQAQGAKLGPCPIVDNDIVICVTQNGKPTTLTIKESQWPKYQAQGAKLGSCPEVVDNDIVICVTQNGKPTTLTIKESQWPKYQAQGAKLGPCPVVEEKLTICHYPPGNNGNPQTIEIPASAWPAHQAHGDKLGPCPEVVDNDIVICVIRSGKPTTMTIKESEWPKYQAQGAKLGPCPEVVDNDIVICVTRSGKPTTITIKESEWPKYQAQGAKLGPCPEVVDNDIVICVTRSGKPTTMTIKESQWPKYQAQGAKLGPCPEVVDNDIVICVTQNGKPTTLTIKESQWSKYQVQGATLGPCPQVVDNDIVICVTQNGKPTTLTIKESQWPQYQAQGATLGTCREVETETTNPSGNTSTIGSTMQICLPDENGVPVTQTIKVTDWKKYEAMGATKGPCPEEKKTDEPNGRVSPETNPKMVPRGRR